ncbi:MAG TPA: hypothetical protein VGO11_20895 [Chthoniobacteraceae bacterium]|jgi:hypothetical protein|nr:hypothetical protein [Chthoniobacteraceae bacterium]
MAGGKRPAPQRSGRRPNRESERRLAFERAPVAPRPWVIPRWWFTAIVALFLLPIAGLLTQTFFGAFSRAAVEHAFWATDEFWFFMLGTVLWSLWFCGSIWSFGEPRPLRLYVFGHELTHAIWVWIMGGEVKSFEVSREGGSIITNKQNVWIALSPYFYPIYTLAIILAYGAVSFFYDVAGVRQTFLWVTPLQWMFLALGITWAFHMSFTIWMIPKGQSDLTLHGTFFSLVFIYLMNVVIMTIFLITAAPEITWFDFGHELLENTENFAACVYALAERLIQRMQQ